MTILATWHTRRVCCGLNAADAYLMVSAIRGSGLIANHALCALRVHPLRDVQHPITHADLAVQSVVVNGAAVTTRVGSVPLLPSDVLRVPDIEAFLRALVLHSTLTPRGRARVGRLLMHAWMAQALESL